MKSKSLALLCLITNLFLCSSFVFHIFAEGKIKEGVISVVVAAWLISNPVAYLRDWPFPLFGDFGFKNGRNQNYRSVGLALTVFFSAALFYVEIFRPHSLD